MDVLELLRPWTTPLDPPAWLRTWQLADSRPTRPDAAKATSDKSNEAAGSHRPSVCWNSLEFEADGEDGETILELLERHGERPSHGCRRGVCRRCVVPLRSGRVRDLRDGRDIDAGTHVRICVTTPLDAVEVEGSVQRDRSFRAETEVTT